MPHPGKGIKMYNQITSEDKEKIKEMYYDYASWEEIGSVLCVSRRAITKVLRQDYNIDTRRKRRYTLNEGYFSNINTEAKAYFLGLMLADGYVNIEGNNTTVAIQLQEDDGYILANMAQELEFTSEVRYVPPEESRYSDKGSYRLAFSSKQMATDLYTLGFDRAKSEYLIGLPQIDNKLVRHMIRGYFDGDGSVAKAVPNGDKRLLAKGNIGYYDRLPSISFIGSTTLLEQIQRIMSKEIRTTDGSFDQSKTKGLYYWALSGGQNIRKVYHYFYDNATVSLKRKEEAMRPVIAP